MVLSGQVRPSEGSPGLGPDCPSRACRWDTRTGQPRCPWLHTPSGAWGTHPRRRNLGSDIQGTSRPAACPLPDQGHIQGSYTQMTTRIICRASGTHGCRDVPPDSQDHRPQARRCAARTKPLRAGLSSFHRQPPGSAGFWTHSGPF